MAVRIFKYLSLSFQVGETLYFNAILAPKESRAKWRATQVWKESDREMVERWSGSALNSRASLGRNGDADGDGDRNDCSDLCPADDCGLGLADDIKFLSDELEDELARILQLSSKDGRLGEEDEDDESIWSIPSPETCTSPDISIHSEPALPFIQQQQQQQSQQQSQQQMTSQTQSQSSSGRVKVTQAPINGLVPGLVSNTISCSSNSSSHHSHRSCHSNSSNNNNNNNNLSNNNTGNMMNGLDNDNNSNNTSISETMEMEIMRPVVRMSVRCISTQTLSTGDIMATQIFHDSSVV